MPRSVGPVLPPGSLRDRAQPVLDVDDHLVLRNWTTDDATVLAAAYRDPDIQQWNLHSFTLPEAERWIAEMDQAWEAETSAGWAIGRRLDEAVLGRVSLREIRLDAGMAEVTYWVIPEARGQGVAPRAVNAISRWALGDLGLHRLELFHSVRNASSCRVADKAGFGYEGTLRSALLHADGWHDMHLPRPVARYANRVACGRRTRLISWELPRSGDDQPVRDWRFRRSSRPTRSHRGTPRKVRRRTRSHPQAR